MDQFHVHVHVFAYMEGATRTRTLGFGVKKPAVLRVLLSPAGNDESD
jgi:hypothetical protein